MKNLFYFLCALNIGYLSWQFHVGQFDPLARQQHRQTPLPGLLLLAEYRAAQRGVYVQRVVESMMTDWQSSNLETTLTRLRMAENDDWLSKATRSTKPPELSNPGPAALLASEHSCFVAGPFPDERAMTIWLKHNALRGLSTTQRQTTSIRDYQVYYPPASSPEQTRQDKAMLAAQGFDGVWMVTSGDNKGGLSLGVFSSAQRAMSFKNQLMAQGIQAAMQPRTETTTQFFATVMFDQRQQRPLEQSGVGLVSCDKR
ncbi:MAG: hypothetical protein KGZ80_04445 [Methylomonas sp.]|nr:hypothetical protein [Methylomonas sp.]PPD22057.1 MAG: hypothetical protein CTY23_03090 [Methylomonas sp.]PPD25249.1 MAG: hypothetical protein CTY22_09380 [Methylomonas sp.]PPD35200.1 MAG: hypothetical protein CTY21_09380 [Methylomonas sp.]PPD42455.1 MAG: hypothetical protein CTY17_01580 [Methylomonas sp.]